MAGLNTASGKTTEGYLPPPKARTFCGFEEPLLSNVDRIFVHISADFTAFSTRSSGNDVDLQQVCPATTSSAAATEAVTRQQNSLATEGQTGASIAPHSLKPAVTS